MVEVVPTSWEDVSWAELSEEVLDNAGSLLVVPGNVVGVVVDAMVDACIQK